MRLEHVPIALLVICVFVIGGVMLIDEVGSNYGKNMSDGEFSNVQNETTVMLNNTLFKMGEGMKNDTFGAEVTDEESYESMIKGSYSALRLVGGSFGLIRTILDDVSNVVGVPPWVIGAGITALIILIVFLLIYLIRGFRL